ncbi:hypothetical protein QZH41_005635 [Actinostola sp. cb2023]|nr:hypothetical protein QZH41_005635 [Actinostola sp. cb2023]
MDEWTNGRMTNEWTNGRMDEWTNGRMDEWTNGRMDEWTNDGWIHKGRRKGRKSHWHLARVTHSQQLDKYDHDNKDIIYKSWQQGKTKPKVRQRETHVLLSAAK